MVNTNTTSNSAYSITAYKRDNIMYLCNNGVTWSTHPEPDLGTLLNRRSGGITRKLVFTVMWFNTY